VQHLQYAVEFGPVAVKKMLEGEIIMIRHIDNQRLQDKNALARELRQAADDITEGQFDLARSRALGATHSKLVMSVQRSDARTTQLIDEWFERMEKRLKVSPDMLDQANVLR
jgi:hypothetical protein